MFLLQLSLGGYQIWGRQILKTTSTQASLDLRGDEKCRPKKICNLFLNHGDDETFIEAHRHDTQYGLRATTRKVKLNPIGEITQMFFYPHHSCQSTLSVLVISSISDLSAVFWPFMPPFCLKSEDKVTSEVKGCSLCVCGGILRALLILWGYMKYRRCAPSYKLKKNSKKRNKNPSLCVSERCL